MTEQRGGVPWTGIGALLLLLGATLAGLQLLTDGVSSDAMGQVAVALMLAGFATGVVGQQRRTRSLRSRLLDDVELAGQVEASFRDDAPRAMRTLAGYVDRVDRAALLSAVHRSQGDLSRLRADLDAHLLHEEP